MLTVQRQSIRPLLPLVCLAALVAWTAGGGLAHAVEKAAFFRGLNLNGPATVIDGHAWEGKEAKWYQCRDNAFENQQVTLVPATDSERARMIRSSRWGGNKIVLTDIPAGMYSVFLYVWEDNNSETFSIAVNGRTVAPKHQSGATGHWDRLGPWLVEANDGAISLTSRGGAANFSGIEIWSGEYDLPGSAEANAEGVAFFEKRIRPLLVQHCYECHSVDSEEIAGDLLVDSRLGLRRGGYSGPAIVPGAPGQSLLFEAVRYKNPDLQMPPKGTLADAEIADFEKWIKLGAPDPREATAVRPKKKTIDASQAASFWSFQPLADPLAPKAADEFAGPGWAYNDIDRFILARLAEQKLKPLADADKRTLLRRATFDLTGLPPTPEEMDAFLADSSPEAFSRVVDRLLDSPRYGERWGRYWLDVVRYADTAGDNSDFPIPQMYLYRNWVIDAFNRDLPYDRFICEQLAGDLLPADDDEARRQQTIATGYIANARRFGSRVSDYPQHLTIEDTIDNLGRAYLGLTLNCARCHDHKFDPVSTEDYYGLYGFFHSTRYPWPGIELEQKQRDLVSLASAEETKRAVEAHQAEQRQLDAEASRLEKERNKASDKKEKERLKKQADAARNAAKRHGKTLPEVSWAYAVAESAKIEDARVQYKGDPAKTGPVVPRRFPAALGGHALASDDATSGRLSLARWIASPDNPLTARVMANRLWLYHFGRGIVPTANDFGKQGKPPTHPELLDWLARCFIDSGWSVKAMHRLIMQSHVYQLAAVPDPAAVPADPANDLLSGFRRRRLDAEAIRDSLLFLGRNLDASQGGPHPFPPSTDWAFTQHRPFKAVYETNRRSVYLMTQRIQRHPYLAIFDGPDPSASTPMRLTSTTPLQSLYLLNDPFVHQQAERIAARLLEERSDDGSRIERAYRLLLARAPQKEERAAASAFLQATRTKLQQARTPPEHVEPLAWQSYVRAMFLLNEFVYID